MEAVARQLGPQREMLIIRNGFFSYRWTQILEMGNIAAESKSFLTARQADEPQAPFAPAPIEEVCAEIAAYRPCDCVCASCETRHYVAR